MKQTDKNAADSYGAMNFHSRVSNVNLFLNKTAVRYGAVTFIGFKRHGDGRIFLKTSPGLT
jgi:hypothetical protein